MTGLSHVMVSGSHGSASTEDTLPLFRGGVRGPSRVADMTGIGGRLGC